VLGAEVVQFGAKVLVFVFEAFVAGAGFVEALLEPVVTMPERFMLPADPVEFAAQLGCFFRCLLPLVDELGGELISFAEGGGEKVAVINLAGVGGGFGLALLAGSPGALTVSGAGPFAGSSSFAWDRHQVSTVTVRDDSRIT
jgi:hypothetical protein